MWRIARWDDFPHARRLTTLLAGAGEYELRRTFAHWLWALGQSLVGSGPAPMLPPKT